MRSRTNAIADISTALTSTWWLSDGRPLEVFAVVQVEIVRVADAVVVETILGPVVERLAAGSFRAIAAPLPAGQYQDRWIVRPDDGPEMVIRTWSFNVAAGDIQAGPGVRPDFRIKRRREERVYQIAQPAAFVWEAPEPVGPEAHVELIISYPGESTTLQLAPMCARRVPIASMRGKQLTPSSVEDLPALRGTIGHFGAAFLQTDALGMHPVKVREVTSDLIELADPPSRALRGAGELTMATWWTVVPARAARILDITWEVRFHSDGGIGATSEHGVLSWVERPFATGLTHQLLIRRAPGLGATMHSRRTSLEEAILAAHEELVSEIRYRIGPREHEIAAGSPGMVGAHVELTLAQIHGDDAERAELHRARALGALTPHGRRIGGYLAGALASVASDADGDGQNSRRRLDSPRQPTRLGAFAGRKRPKPFSR